MFQGGDSVANEVSSRWTGGSVDGVVSVGGLAGVVGGWSGPEYTKFG
jgi:hypothetical protein